MKMPGKQQPSKPSARERELHGVRRERTKDRPSRGRERSRQSVFMRQLKRRSQLRRRLLAKEVGAHYLDWRTLVSVPHLFLTGRKGMGMLLCSPWIAIIYSV